MSALEMKIWINKRIVRNQNYDGFELFFYKSIARKKQEFKLKKVKESMLQ